MMILNYISEQETKSMTKTRAKTKTRRKSDEGSLSQEASLPFGYKSYPGEEERCAQRNVHGMIEK